MIPIFFHFRVSQLDNEFLEFYGSLQLCHESKKRQFFDQWKTIDDKPPLQSSLGIEPVIPQVASEEVRSFFVRICVRSLTKYVCL